MHFYPHASHIGLLVLHESSSLPPPLLFVANYEHIRHPVLCAYVVQEVLSALYKKLCYHWKDHYLSVSERSVLEQYQLSHRSYVTCTHPHQSLLTQGSPCDQTSLQRHCTSVTAIIFQRVLLRTELRQDEIHDLFFSADFIQPTERVRAAHEYVTFQSANQVRLIHYKMRP